MTDQLSFAKKVRLDPISAMRDLAEQHFNEALDNLQENARQTLFEVLYDDQRLSLPFTEFEHLLDLYTKDLATMIRRSPATYDEETT
jgi:hypothetical protein